MMTPTVQSREITMSHNIGEMFYYGELPWHTLGNKLDHPANLSEALKAGGLDWEVDTVPLVPAGEPHTEISHRVAVVRKDRQPGEPGRVVGVVHPGFQPLQNRQGAMMFDALLGQGERVYHTGGYLKNGEVIWLMAKLPGEIRVRGDDVLETYLLFTNSHDGSIGIDIRLTTVRVVCQNTLSMALHKNNTAGKVFRRSHSGSYALLQEDAKGFFEFTTRQCKEAEALFSALAAKRCGAADFDIFLKNLMPDPKRPATAHSNPSVLRAYETRLATMKATRKDITGVHVEGIPDRSIPPAESTWWGALNTITGWVDHRQHTDSDRYAHVLLGSGDRLKSAALTRIRVAAGCDERP
jgi:phage/plasmid-like protein (TIGR03299 family)